MSLKRFLSDKLLMIVLSAAALATSEIFMLMYNVSAGIMIYTGVTFTAAITVGLAVEYIKKNRFYGSVTDTLEGLEEKYLISEIMEAADFEEGRILNEVLEETERSRVENVRKAGRALDEYKSYLELWIHEVKMPIATVDLIMKNNPGEVSKKVEKELVKIEDYTQQALFYARSATVEKDYLIVKCNLKCIVNAVIRKDKDLLIARGIRVNATDTDVDVYTDGKWLGFIIGQIVANSIEYMDVSVPQTDGSEVYSDKIIEAQTRENKAEPGELVIFARENPENVELVIRDNGCGIRADELPRVFDKGFTGTNGRADGRRSTGIGLYLCKKLCDKMNVGIRVESQPGCGCEVTLTLPSGSYTGEVI